MSRATGLALAALVLVPASAGAGTRAGTAGPELALTATPAHVSLVGSGRATIRVTNSGLQAVGVDVGRAGFALDLRGRPRMVRRAGARAATSWVSVRPARFLLPAGATRSVTVSSRLPSRVEPGDHDALVLLTTRPKTRARVAVRMRMGVVVVVRAPGRVVRRLTLRSLRVRRARRGPILELLVVNRGNVSETLPRGRVQVTLRRGPASTRLRAAGRELRPRTTGIVELVYRGRLRGWVTARVEIASRDGGPAVARTFRVKL